MPNWCNNNIEIIGPKEKVDALIKGAKAGEFLDTLYPMPKALEGGVHSTSEAPSSLSVGFIMAISSNPHFFDPFLLIVSLLNVDGKFL